MKSRWSRRYIQDFIHRYKIDMTETVPAHFGSFDDFFCRRLKIKARPFPSRKEWVGFPVDGRHLGFQSLREGQDFFAKGESFNLERLFRSSGHAKWFEEGTLVISRLCPLDYHRVHFPVDGIPTLTRLINGFLYSVNPLVLWRNARCFLENKRFVTFVDSPELRKIALIEVGATGVGSVEQKFVPFVPVRRGQEKGCFHWGGSTVITLFQKGRVRLAEDLLTQTQRGYELFARCGDMMAEAVS
jgi:phosphatidylserine decarboxylase